MCSPEVMMCFVFDATLLSRSGGGEGDGDEFKSPRGRGVGTTWR